jgi:hypothetical protein
MFSLGFCPSWTYTPLAGRDPDVNSTFYAPFQHPTCVGNDPDARHFCMDSKGNINSTAATSVYQCDPQYDALDYARDRVDFAALSDYTATQKGNFIAMYSIFFAHQTATTLNEYILGVKFARYISDAGDNGIIDNPIQRWYRDSRDGVVLDSSLPNYGVTPPPTGGYGMVLQTTAGTTVVTNAPAGITGGPHPQPRLPFYSATNPFWTTSTTYNYDTSADPCAADDYFFYQNPNSGYSNPNINNAHDTFLNEANDQAEYERRAQAQCGDYYYANGAQTLRQAFQSIASRLFTRLTG